MKKCGKCKLVLPVENFSKNKSKKDGWHDWCKKCVVENARKWRAEHREQSRESSRRWAQLNREKSNAIKYAWCKRHPEQRKKISHSNYLKTRDKKLEAQVARRFIRENLLTWFQETGRTIQKPQKTQECPSCGILTLPSALLFFDGQILCCWCVEDIHKTQPYKRPPIVYKKCPDCGRQTLDLKDGRCPDCRIKKKAERMVFIVKEFTESDMAWRSQQKNLR